MTAQAAAELLRKELLPFTPEMVKEVLQGRNLEAEGGLSAFTQAVLEEGVRWTMKALDGFWEALGDAPSPRGVSTIEGWLRDGGRVRVSYLETRGYPLRKEGVKVEIRNENENLVDVMELYPPKPLPFSKGFTLNAWVGYLEFANYTGLHVLNDQVFFQRGSRQRSRRGSEDCCELAFPFLCPGDGRHEEGLLEAGETKRGRKLC
jgi:hypothetical protein